MQAEDMWRFNRVMNLEQRYLFGLFTKNCSAMGAAQSSHQTCFLEIQ
jgi:hypothetical protein